jgi:isoquinoline 1-oxidoreductase
MSDTFDLQDIEIEIERYELESEPDCTSRPCGIDLSLSRRDLIKLLGAGILVVCLSSDVDGQESGRGQRRGGGSAPREIGAWIHVGEDGTITAFSGKVEVGQNARTSLSMVVAEELKVPITSVRMVMADTELTPYDMGTFGSQTTPRMVPILREAAAAAREALLNLAAEEWKADRTALVVSGGRIIQRGGTNSATYGHLTKGRKLTQTIRPGVSTTPPEKWKVAGHPAHKVNARDIVTGKHKYTSDIERPGMLFGKVLRPDAISASLISADTSQAEALTGVTVVRSGTMLGLVAHTQHLAAKALDAIKAEWKVEPQVSSRDLYQHLFRTGQGADGKAGVFSDEASSALEKADARVVDGYTVAYIAHAPLEPRAAVAEWNGDKLTVWTGTQRPFGVRQELASAFGMPESNVRVIVPDTGSGYGGKHTGEAAIEAARLAKEAGQPVKLVWTREEEFRFAYARPAGFIDVRAGVMKDGTIVAWEFHNYNSGGSSIGLPYECSTQKIAFHRAQPPLKQGSYRGLAATANNFARECHIDDLARAIKMDPVAFRLKNLKEERMRGVLQAAGEKFGWGRVKPEAGHGFGIACGTEKGSYVATCVEVALEPANSGVKVTRAVTAFECGAIINPEHLKNQVEGAVVQGLGGALFESIEFENGRILNPRFSKYRVPRFSDTPILETVLLDRKDLPSAGAGETPIIVIAPAIGNAIVDAGGRRIRSLPMVGGAKQNGRD